MDEPPQWDVDDTLSIQADLGRASALSALKQFAIDHKFALVIKNSCATRLTLKYAQGGAKRSHKAVSWEPEEYLRTPRTKQAGCTYEVALAKHRDQDKWSVSSWSWTHAGHRRLGWEEISALPSVRRSLNEKHGVLSKAVQLYDSGTEPRAVWHHLKASYS